MGNLDITQRNNLERSTLSGSDGLRRGSERGSMIYVGITLILAGVLAYGALTTIDNWSQWVVLGVILVTTVGAIIALSPTRRGI